MAAPFDIAWRILKEAYGFTESGADFPEPEPDKQLQNFSYLGDMRQGKMNPDVVDAKMTIEEALEFNRQMAALPKPEPEPEPEEELAPEGVADEYEEGGYLTLPFPKAKI